MVKAISTTLIVVCLSLYPLIVYFGLQYISVQTISVVLIALVCLRLLLSQQLLKKLPWLLPASIFALVTLAIAYVTNNDAGLRLYPVIINSMMAITFIFSLFRGPTIIESFARLQEPELDDKGIAYTRNVTKVWSLFFIINGVAALYTCLYSSLAVWSLYNGLISYILIGLIMAIEWLVRKRVRNNAG